MPLVVTHVILTILAVDIYRDFIVKWKKMLPLSMLLIAGFAAILPDIDILIGPVLGFFGYYVPLLDHGGVTHTLIFGLVFLIPAMVFRLRKERRMELIFYIITFAVLFHVFLDYLLGGGSPAGLMLFWPLSSECFKIHLLGYSGVSMSMVILDAVILMSWLTYALTKHRIKDFL